MIGFAPLVGVGLVLGADVVSPSSPFGWLGAVILSLLGAWTLWRSGAIKAWKETAEAREQRIEDMARELEELRAELKIPERIEGIIGLMGEISVRQDAAADVRIERAFARLETRLGQLEDSIRDACAP